MKLEERLKVLGEKWANLPAGKEANEIADECMDKLPELLSKIEELEKACAEMRYLIKEKLQFVGNGPLEQEQFYCPICNRCDFSYHSIPHKDDCLIKHALSASSGSDYIHRDEIKPLVEAFKDIQNTLTSGPSNFIDGFLEDWLLGKCIAALTHADKLLKGEKE